MIPLEVDDKPTKRRPIQHTKEQTASFMKQWDAAPTIIEQLPIKFKNGSRLDTYEGSCGFCSKPVPPGDFRGSITFPIPSVAVVEALAGCVECNAITHYLHRVRDDMSLQWREPGGEWVTAKMRVKGRKNRIRFWMRSLKRRLFPLK